MRSAMPPYSISSPANTKNGMARKENTCMPPTIFWKTTATGKPAATMVATEDRPMAKATGTPRSKKSVKLRVRMVNSMASVPGGFNGLAAQDRHDVLDREQHDQHAGNDHRHIVDAIGHGQHGLFLAPFGAGPQPAALHHEHTKGGHQRVDQQLDAALPHFGQEHDQRFESDVAGIAHAH